MAAVVVHPSVEEVIPDRFLDLHPLDEGAMPEMRLEVEGAQEQEEIPKGKGEEIPLREVKDLEVENGIQE